MFHRHPRRPHIHTQIELQRHWQRSLPRFGRHQWGLRFMFISIRDTASRIGFFSDVTGPLDATQYDGFGRVIVEYFLEGEPRLWRVAFLLTRPGAAVQTPDDIAWAASLYDACRRVGVACEIVHVAAGDRVIPLPPDDMPDLAVGF